MALKALYAGLLVLGVWSTPSAYGQNRSFTMENATIDMAKIQPDTARYGQERYGVMGIPIAQTFAGMPHDTAVMITFIKDQVHVYHLGDLGYYTVSNVGGETHTQHMAMWDEKSGVGAIWKPQIPTVVSVHEPEQFFRTGLRYEGVPILTDNLSHSGWLPALGRVVSGVRMGDVFPTFTFYITTLADAYGSELKAKATLPRQRDIERKRVRHIPYDELVGKLVYVFNLSTDDGSEFTFTAPLQNIPTPWSKMQNTPVGQVDIRYRTFPKGAVDVEAPQGVHVQRLVMYANVAARFYPNATVVQP